jgi:hypothetical protein
LVAFFNTIEVTAPDTYVHDPEGMKQAMPSYIAHSLDHGATWTRQSVVSTPRYRFGVTSNPLSLSDGSILFPIECLSEKGTIGVHFAHGHGEKPVPGSFSPGIFDPEGEFYYCDPRFTPLGTEEILAMLWTVQKEGEKTVEVHRSTSTDGGFTWSRPSPLGFIGEITTPLAIDDRIILAAGNYRYPPDGILLRISRDRGQTWDSQPPIRMWDPNCQQLTAEPVTLGTRSATAPEFWDGLQKYTFGTPGLLRLTDGSILMTYYATQGGVTHIRACKFTIEI